MARMARPTAAGSRQDGFTYLALLVILASMGVGLAAAGTLWSEVQHRAREQELLFVGLQYRNAIRGYYEAPGSNATYPPSIEALLLDPRSPSPRRHLRRPWRDPLTQSPEWGLVMAPQGGIMGVYSLSSDTPIKRANFPAILKWSDGLGSYADWKFIYVPEQGALNLPPR